MQVKQNRSLAHAEETIVGTVQTAFKEFDYNCKKTQVCQSGIYFPALWEDPNHGP